MQAIEHGLDGLALKHGRKKLTAGRTADQFLTECAALSRVDMRALTAACDAYRDAERPRNRPDLWKQTQESLRHAVTAYTRRIEDLLASYIAE